MSRPKYCEVLSMPFTRRHFVLMGSLAPAAFSQAPPKSLSSTGPAIDRKALVTRHNPVLTDLAPRSPLSVGNGEFAFTADVTGLQTFPELHVPSDTKKAMPLATQSQWGWHSFPLPAELQGKSLVYQPFDTYGRSVGYATSDNGQKELFSHLRRSPHRIHLGELGFVLTRTDGSPAQPADLRHIRQELDLWNGILRSHFVLDGFPVDVETACHPTLDCLIVRVRSALLQNSRAALRLRFPYGSPDITAADWTQPDRHSTQLNRASGQSARITRSLDADKYHVALSWKGAAQLEQTEPHVLLLRPQSANLTLLVSFAVGQPGIPKGDVFAVTSNHWQRFWQSGGAIDLSAATDSRAREIERRIVLSQYLTAIQCAGSLPPQETGLTCNSWNGKFHLEMHWWHAAHFPLWGRAAMLERSLDWYRRILPSAQATARRQGYTGARWPKMVGPDGNDSPSSVGTLLVWQQPHIIAFAELLWQANPTPATLRRYADLVFESAEFMASFAVERDGRFVLGPPLIPAQENHPPRETWNPTFELEYWHYALGVALTWRERLGLPETAQSAQWRKVRQHLSRLPVAEGVYLAHENCPQTFTERNKDHPSMLGALGILPGEMVDKETMRRTLKRALKDWRWPDTWGWDYPLTAMTAARLDEPELAVDALLLDSPKNEWLPNGHNYQRANLPLYLPGNGGVLAATALMAAGWQGRDTATPAPGFPKSWKVRYEGLNAWL